MVYCKTSLKTKWGYTRSFLTTCFSMEDFCTIPEKEEEGQFCYLPPPVKLGLKRGCLLCIS